MTLVFPGNVQAVGNAVTLSQNDSVIVPVGYMVISTGANGIIGTNTHTVTIGGTVAGDSDGINLGESTTDYAPSRVVVLAGAQVSAGDDAIQMRGGGTSLVNEGTLSGNFGVFLANSSTVASTVGNYGSIFAIGTGILATGNAMKRVFNAGVIEGTSWSYASSDGGVDLLTNAGLMRGNVNLGSGDDIYDGTGGQVIGTVLGGLGNDIFVPGAAVDVFDGEDGIDTLDFRNSAGVKVALDGSIANTGSAVGDSYAGIERIFGSRTGADQLIGDSANNNLYGYGGADLLKGGAGTDRLDGGAAVDTLTGGSGNDTFVFVKPVESGDLITDFGSSATNNDRFYILASGFGGGLVAGGTLAASQFQIRADNVAQDANDRFIFRTTDKTLWFDSNGSGAGGLYLVADLQSSAVVTALDLILI